MEILLLKSSACLFALLAFYKLALEPLSIHKFKRVYLLAAVIIAAIIPFITFIKYVDPTFNFGAFDPNATMTPPNFSQDLPTVIKTKPLDYLPTILWTIYGLGASLFLVRFCINLFEMHSKIKKHKKVKNNRFVNVLMEQLEVPHTFFNFIFLNKNKFESNQIPDEVLLHEQSHAKQKHSLDIIVIELIQIVFWFNPLVYWLKKEIKLNHEFLADHDVIKQGVDTKTYQTILLQFSSNQQELALVNAINYSSIKKRFTLMKTQTSKQAVWLRSLLLLPLLAILLFSFSQTKEMEKESTPKMEIEKNNAPTKLFENEKENSLNDVLKNSVEKIQENYITTPILEINQNPFELKLNGKATSFKNLNEDFKKITLNKTTDLKINSNGNAIDIELIKKISELLKPNIKNVILSDGIKITDKQKFTKTDTNTGFITQNPTLTVNGIVCDGCQLNLSKKGVEKIILGTTTNDNITGFKLKIPGVKTQIIKGNKLNDAAKQLVLNTKQGYFIRLFDIKSKSNTFSTVSIKIVDKNDENYSESPKVKKGEDSQLPPPPPPPTKAPEYGNNKKLTLNQIIKKTPKNVESGYEVLKNGESHYYTIYNGKKTYYNKEGYITDKDGDVLPPPPPPPAPTAEYNDRRAKIEAKRNEIMAKRQEKLEEIEEQRVLSRKEREAQHEERKNTLKHRREQLRNNPPPPPPPMSTTDHIIKMKKKGATFYYNGKAITPDKAIELVKNNSELNISSNTNNGVSTVHLSEKPIKTVNGKIVND